MLLLLIINHTLLDLAHRLGPFASIALGLVDGTGVPLPGSMDALAILLAAARPELWWYYGLMATLGSLLGGFLVFQIARAGGKEALEKKLGKERAEKAYRYFQHLGFWSVFIGGLAPPPVPTVAFLMAAGALQYSRRLYLLALATSRLLRFMALTWVTAHYGRSIFHFLSRYYMPALWTLIAVALVGGLIGLAYYLRYRKHKMNSGGAAPKPKAA